METVSTILFVVVVTVILSLVSLRQKNSTWEGTLVDKHEDQDDESGKTIYYLTFQTNSGRKRVNLSSDKAGYNAWNVGDNGVKKSGEYLPQKTH